MKTMRELFEAAGAIAESHPLEKYIVSWPRGWGVADGLRFKKDQEAWKADQVKLISKAKNLAVRLMRDADRDDEQVFDSAGEVNVTGVSEFVAHEMDHSEWLNDDGHWIWDVVADEAEKWEKIHRK